LENVTATGTVWTGREETGEKGEGGGVLRREGRDFIRGVEQPRKKRTRILIEKGGLAGGGGGCGLKEKLHKRHSLLR